jgi:hypothetical protein
MSRGTLLRSGAVLIAAATAGEAQATVWSVRPTADTYISAGPIAGDTNFGSNPELRTRWSSAVDNYRSFLRFNLPADLGPGSVLNAATVSVSGTTETNNDTKRIQVVGLVESYDTWSESTLTYNNSNAAGVDNSLIATQPGFVAGAITDPFLDNTANGPMWETGVQRQTFSLLGNGATFQNFLSSDTNDSITLVLMPISTSTYQSSESLLAHRPVLTIDYTPVPEPASLALIGVGALRLLGRRKRA